MSGWRELPFRVRDVLVSGAALVVLWPVLATIALAVKCDSPGPALFKQRRVGLRGRTFEIHKFRTMRAGGTGLAITADGDPRVTRVGRFLRASKLDELIQLWDVLRGEMSLVGPRPEVPRYVAEWPSHLREEILSVRPGITDPATVLLRSESELLAMADDPERFYVDVLLPQKAHQYAQYVRSRSLAGDIRIVLETIVAIVRPTAAASGADVGH
ncbi:sugar transferase [Microbacterium sp.]|jgi:lipopolysaccharide/colanic/teichoic acid biosynthesis glycosyltransferase|uniref:sugar transferase n=1 Tax=Microbacterium sp. TaxID=51671 RepID=UPI002BD31820|nr:sugar transferase [Microbacterium sp.]HWL78717.1 sugar transferase [Microbacterium sp.]